MVTNVIGNERKIMTVVTRLVVTALVVARLEATTWSEGPGLRVQVEVREDTPVTDCRHLLERLEVSLGI